MRLPLGIANHDAIVGILTAVFNAGKKVDVAYDDTTITACEFIVNCIRVVR